MGFNFKGCDRGQGFLMPPNIRDWIPEGDLVWFVIDAVEGMDLSSFYARYRPDGWGNAAYDPAMMVSLLIYAYCLGERSSRKIERLCERDIAFRLICANHVPDHATIARFRQNNEEGLEGLFCEVLRLCAEVGLLKVGLLALDGTKIRARASLDANRSHDYLREEVRRWLDEAEEADAREDRLWGTDRRGDELPPELRRSQDRRRRIKECLERLDREAREVESKRREQLSERKEEERRSGKKKRGRKPKSPEKARDDQEKKAKANITDPDSRIMKTRSGYLQGYNAQAVVTEDQVIVAAELTPKENDVGQLHPMVEQAKENLARVAVTEGIGAVVADAGYFSEDNLKGERGGKERGEGPELYIAVIKDRKQRAEPQEPEPEQAALPEDATERQKMERKLRTEEGRAAYKKRGQMVEPVFGQIKEGRGFNRFSRRGHPACRSEWRFVCAAHNLLKLWRYLASTAPMASLR
jgi:transposase|uniref:DDE transposase n=1 Tax=Anaerolinea thermolimosa TaxID=229919 RepID=A0A7C4PMS5_9CHLR